VRYEKWGSGTGPTLHAAVRRSREEDASIATRLYGELERASGHTTEAAEHAGGKAESAGRRLSKDSYDEIIAALRGDDD
jgi:hypothetical protein